jgi:cysteine dioxygenase
MSEIPPPRDVVTQVTIDPSVRDGLLAECPGLSGLVEWLDSIDRRPGLAELDHQLKDLKVNLAALKECIGYADDGYQRNVIKKSEFYELVAVCWLPGQETPIHDHVGSDCAFLIVDGISTETIYETNEEGLAYPITFRHYQPREVCAAEEPDIHRVSNDTDSELVNLHIYTPPLHAYNIYAPA